jgi:hypothetical protein
VRCNGGVACGRFRNAFQSFARFAALNAAANVALPILAVRRSRIPRLDIGVPLPLATLWVSRSGLLSDLIQTDHFEPEIPESVEDAVELGRVNDICRQQSCSTTRLSGELLKGGCK